VAGQVLYGSRRTYLRKVAVPHFDGVCANTTLVLEANGDVLLQDLLPFIMQTEAFTEYSVKNSKGSVNPYINWGDIATYEFPLPPLDEQRRIAEILWAADEAVERYKHSTTAQALLKRTLVKTLFHSEDEPEVRLGDVGTWVSGGTPRRSSRDHWEGEVPWASPKDMKVDILKDTEEHVSEEGAASSCRLVPKGTILVVVRGMILAHSFPVALTGRPMAFNQDMKALIVSENFDPKFVFYWLQGHSEQVRRMVSDSSHGTKRIPTELLLEMKIPKFARARQTEIVNHLEKCDRAAERLQRHVHCLLNVKRGLLAELLA
jgi:type I restriction enzyme S subunit